MVTIASVFVNMSSSLKLYAHPQSPPARTVALTLDVFKIDYEYVYLDLFAGAARKPEYLKVANVNKCNLHKSSKYVT